MASGQGHVAYIYIIVLVSQAVMESFDSRHPEERFLMVLTVLPINHSHVVVAKEFIRLPAAQSCCLHSLDYPSLLFCVSPKSINIMNLNKDFEKSHGPSTFPSAVQSKSIN